MPTIYDNESEILLDSLKETLQTAKRGDFCVGYFNLRGWVKISRTISSISRESGKPACRLIVGMPGNDDITVHCHYADDTQEITQKIASKHKEKFARDLAKQLTYGIPTDRDERGLKKLAMQLREGVLQVKFFGAYPLHAKLYLAHTDNRMSPIVGYVGSSNLTMAGLVNQGELNIDVLDIDATKKLADWFEGKWTHRWCLDISDQLAEIIEKSWAGNKIHPYEIYIKTAYELSKDAIDGAQNFKIPQIFQNKMLEFQIQAVTLAVQKLYSRRGVIISDVVGLGKTIVASAVAKTFQEDYGGNILVICPPNLKGMWEHDYLEKYEISGKALSLGKTKNLDKMKRFPTLIIDESHNLRNRESHRHAQVKRYIEQNECRVILITATPYNKQFTDMSSQLRLFLNSDMDLGIQPSMYIQELKKSGSDFKVKHTNTLVSSLAAFEHSDCVDDWRELMRVFMIRRTRNHIKQNYAQKDPANNLHYLTFKNGQRHYFPKRISQCLHFSIDNDKEDQYSTLYSEKTVDTIANLKLPRYGLGEYLTQKGLPDRATAQEKRIAKNFNRAGRHLIGFTKSQLFKRLESCGPSFVLSIQRHILRNAIYLAAWRKGQRLPIGNLFTLYENEENDDLEKNDDDIGNFFDLEYFLKKGSIHYEEMLKKADKKIQWINVEYFNKSIADDLEKDCKNLIEIISDIGLWNARNDRKLIELRNLCMNKHRNEKLLVFTQYKDTAEYLHRELLGDEPNRIKMVSGKTDHISDIVKNFSPDSNGLEKADNPIRILITTDSLSEGQNLQDCRIIVNFDLPWATIRLIQRAGRVDRIGQKATEILCYSFLPEDGVEKVIGLRARLDNRLNQSAQILGSDEKFFDDKEINLERIYNDQAVLEETDDDVDLITRAYDIWQQAIKDNPDLENQIKSLPDVAYSAKRTKEQASTLAYIRTDNNHHFLVQVDADGNIISQSQSKVLDLLQCLPSERRLPPATNHHESVATAVKHVQQAQMDLSGNLGGSNNIRNKIYNKLNIHRDRWQSGLFKGEHSDIDLRDVIEGVYRYPFKEAARDKLVRLNRQGASDTELIDSVVGMWKKGRLLAIPEGDGPTRPHIICSIGLLP
ncbi:helicase-related protein [Thioalkalivibrio sp. HK1]|uniref:helicase-related protein n=1 Tax=Thioalkalivibrio sp. HK1 TaxID=1469245 RepID=UPI0004718599|nr:helicase-related protein [Thioalkalivibrio sp. HK1]